MQLIKKFITPLAFLGAALIAVLVAFISVGVIENLSKTSVDQALLLEGVDWAKVETDGLQVVMTGTAPDESTRFQAMRVASGEVEPSRIIDHMEVPLPEAVVAPTFSMEILRNGAGISMIGLVPASTDREALGKNIQRIAGDKSVTDLLESADYPAPEGWDEAVSYAIEALSMLPRSKVSMKADRIEIEAISDSEDQKRDFENKLARAAPGGVQVALDISAPRPVITPFTLRFIKDESGARFDACTAGTEAGRRTIVAAGSAAGVSGRPDCTIGLGLPSPDWPEAAALAISALAEMGAGSVTFSDADVTLVAESSVAQRDFDRIAGELEADLPDVFSLHATKTAAPSADDQGPPEFIATRGADGQVQLRGKLLNEQERTITESMARARFGVGQVYSATRLDETLPGGWSVRVLAAVEALSYLVEGSATVQPDVVIMTGTTGDSKASAEISRLLSAKLGEAEDFRVNVTYDEALDPRAALPTPQECVRQVNAALTGAKITFAPGSVEIEASAGPTVDKIADILKSCPDVAMEIGGHTDSQGSEELNKSLSQRRADSVLNALLARRVLTSNLAAHGYGEEQPIADNDTEAGREANRRIEFRLVGQADLPESAVESLTSDAAPDAAPDAAASAQVAPGETPAQTSDEAQAELPDVRPAPRPEDLVPDDQRAAEEQASEAVTEEDATAPEAPAEEALAESATPQEPDAGEAQPEATATEDQAGDEAQNEVAPALSDAPEAPAAVADTPELDAPADPEAAPAASEINRAVSDAEGEPVSGAFDFGDTAAGADAPAAESMTESTLGAATESAAETATETATETAVETEEALGDPIVVHPELEGIRPRPRPAQ